MFRVEKTQENNNLIKKNNLTYGKFHRFKQYHILW